MYSFFKRLFSPSVDAILADFNKVTVRLKAAVDFHTIEASIHDAAIKDAVELKSFALAEVARAKVVIGNVEMMLGIA